MGVTTGKLSENKQLMITIRIPGPDLGLNKEKADELSKALNEVIDKFNAQTGNKLVVQ